MTEPGPDPQEANRRNQAGDQHRTEAWRKGHESFGNLSFGWDCLDCTEHGQDLPDGLAAERGAEWHARHPHHALPRAGALAEISLDELPGWDELAEALGATLTNHPAGESGEYDTRMHWPDGRSASGRDLLIIVSADADLPSPAEQLAAAGMAVPDRLRPPQWQRYSTGQSLTDTGVAGRLAQYRADREGDSPMSGRPVTRGRCLRSHP